jgi:alpha-L-fucosidase
MAKVEKANRSATGGRELKSAADRKRVAWWNEARFGMFIHWGIYTVPAGHWRGQEIEGIGEWIMHRARIPAREYEKLAPKFNPVRFDARAWVELAVTAGMKYLVITAKHHDGFALFNSPCSEYDIFDATPFGRDPMAELAAECKRTGIRLCFYYSQDQDWHHAHAFGNDWDYNSKQQHFSHYLEEKCKPQVRELLTQYGPIGLIWFDTPYSIGRSDSVSLRRLVRRLQPDCIVSGRVGHDVGDYGSLGDNQIPQGRLEGLWETPATMNDTWAFKTSDHNWKSVQTLLALLADLAGKGVNYLLNVGPTSTGVIPRPSIRRLRAIGAWMQVHGEAIYGSRASPFPYSFKWGAVTRKGNKLYLLFTSWQGGRFTLHGLRSRVRRVYVVSTQKRTLALNQSRIESLDHDILTLELPAKKPDVHVSVIALELDGQPTVDPAPLQQPDGTLKLLPSMAHLHLPHRGRHLSLSHSGVVQDWHSKSNWMSWKMKVLEAGSYRVRLVTGTLRYGQGHSRGHQVELTIGKFRLSRVLRADEKLQTPRAQYFPELASNLGTVEIETAGFVEVKLKVSRFNKRAKSGLALAYIEMTPKR